MEEELGQGWTAGMHPDDRDGCVAELLASQQERVPFELECRLRRADGEYRSVLCRGVPRFEPDGAFAGYVASAIDITDLKRALAGQKLESLGVLASGIAHDFNKLLGGILAGSELLLSDVEDVSLVRGGTREHSVDGCARIRDRAAVDGLRGRGRAPRSKKSTWRGWYAKCCS